MLAAVQAIRMLCCVSGEEVRVDVDREQDEIVVRRAGAERTASPETLLGWIDRHLATARRHPANDRSLAGG
ncbi:MAG: hypothetical protein ACYC91_19515 [Solirubrobacteraceae bacterium]